MNTKKSKGRSWEQILKEDGGHVRIDSVTGQVATKTRTTGELDKHGYPVVTNRNPDLDRGNVTVKVLKTRRPAGNTPGTVDSDFRFDPNTGGPIPDYAAEYQRQPLINMIEAGYPVPNPDGKDLERMIERQERTSTEAAAKTSRLPIKGIDAYREGGEYGYLGFKVGERCSKDPNELFCHVELPKGWKASTTGHSMWNDILDEKGRKRSSYFFKGAFYDRDAHMSSPNRRFSVTNCGPRYQSPYGPDDKPRGYFDTAVIDSEKAVYDHTGAVNEEAIVYRLEGKRDAKKYPKAYEQSDAFEEQVKAWMNENYPGWDNPANYWEEKEIK